MTGATPATSNAGPALPRTGFGSVLGLVLLTQCAAAVAGAFILWRAIDQAREASLHVSVIARERAALDLLTDRATMVAAATIAHQPHLAQRLAMDIDAFDQVLVALERGGDAAGDAVVPLAGAPQTALAGLAQRWRDLRGDVVTLARAPPASRDFTGALARVEAPLASLAEAFGGLAQVTGRRALELRARAGAMLGGVLLAQLAALGGALWFTRRAVVEPAEALARAAEQERAGAADARAQLEAELRLAAQHDSIGRLTAGIAHEVNTPIQFINDSVQFLRDAFADVRVLIAEYRAYVRTQAAVEARARFAELERKADLPDLEASVREALERSQEGLSRITALVRALKELARPDANELGPVDLNRVVESAITVAHNQCKYVAEVQAELGDVPNVNGHASDMARAVLHLLINAAQATGEVTRQSGQKGVIRVRTAREQDRAVLTIADRGAGMAGAVDASTHQGGALAAARAIVDRLGGDLTFSSEPGRGTTCCVRLPLMGRHQPAAGVA